MANPPATMATSAASSWKIGRVSVAMEASQPSELVAAAASATLVLAGLLILAASMLFNIHQGIPLEQPAALGHGSSLVAAVTPRLEGQL